MTYNLEDLRAYVFAELNLRYVWVKTESILCISEYMTVQGLQQHGLPDVCRQPLHHQEGGVHARGGRRHGLETRRVRRYVIFAVKSLKNVATVSLSYFPWKQGKRSTTYAVFAVRSANS